MYVCVNVFYLQGKENKNVLYSLSINYHTFLADVTVNLLIKSFSGLRSIQWLPCTVFVNYSFLKQNTFPHIGLIFLFGLWSVEYSCVGFEKPPW